MEQERTAGLHHLSLRWRSGLPAIGRVVQPALRHEARHRDLTDPAVPRLPSHHAITELNLVVIPRLRRSSTDRHGGSGCDLDPVAQPLVRP
ncbi:hypothetical protein D3C81_1356160 [compost metagenome]